MAVSLAGKIALITGASRGMGREVALAYARAGITGITIVAAAASDETRGEIQAELDGVAAEIEAIAGKGKVLALQGDVTNWADCQAVVQRTVETFGALHILYNNAGKSPRYHGARDIPFWETEPDGWLLVLNTNVVGPYRMAKAAMPHLLKAGWGRIINTSKTRDSMHSAFAGAYGPSKAALEAQSISWAEELADTKVTVNSIDPGGAVNTKFGRGTITGRGLSPDVLVPVALWLASDESDGINGCRFTAKLWDPSLPAKDAAARCRDIPLFPTPKRKTKLTTAWDLTGGR